MGVLDLANVLMAPNSRLRIVMGIVPMSVKLAIVVGMGILVSMIGMVSVGLVVGNEKTLVGLGEIEGRR